MSVNVNFIARLGADAEVIESSKGKFITMRAVVNEYKGKGESEAIWFKIVTDCSDFNMNMLQYWTKGKLLSFVGKEKVSLYTAKDGSVGIDRTVRAFNIDFVSGGTSGDTSNQTSTSTIESQKQEQPMVADCGTFKKPSVENDDDLPF